MNDNESIIVLHVDNETGQVVQAELEDPDTGERTPITGNFDEITLSQSSPKSQMDWRVGDPAPKV